MPKTTRTLSLSILKLFLKTNFIKNVVFMYIYIYWGGLDVVGGGAKSGHLEKLLYHNLPRKSLH
jgi:hypothetical protein